MNKPVLPKAYTDQGHQRSLVWAHSSQHTAFKPWLWIPRVYSDHWLHIVMLC